MSFSSRAKNSVVDLFQCHYRVWHLKKQQLVVHIVDEHEMVAYREDQIMEDLKWFDMILDFDTISLFILYIYCQAH